MGKVRYCPINTDTSGKAEWWPFAPGGRWARGSVAHMQKTGFLHAGDPVLKTRSFVGGCMHSTIACGAVWSNPTEDQALQLEACISREGGITGPPLPGDLLGTSAPHGTIPQSRRGLGRSEDAGTHRCGARLVARREEPARHQVWSSRSSNLPRVSPLWIRAVLRSRRRSRRVVRGCW